jgi:26S proteasome regulatory subunit N1
MLTNAPAAEEELSEEDQQLKNELDMMVERLTVSFFDVDSGAHALMLT